MKLDKEEILRMINLILEEYVPFSERMEYSVKTQENMNASNAGIIAAINVIIRNYSKSGNDAWEIVNSVKGRTF